MKVVVITNPYYDGRISVIYPADGVEISHIIETQVDLTKEYFIMNYDDLPNDDNDYFNSWVFDRNELGEPFGIKIDMIRARDIYRDQLREKRKPLLEALDVKYIRALEMQNSDLINEIVIEKQKLRNITTDARIDTAMTIKELRELSLL